MKTNHTLLQRLLIAMLALCGMSVEAVADDARIATRDELSASIVRAVEEILPAGIVLEKLGAVSDIKVPRNGYSTLAHWPGERVFRRRVSFPVDVLLAGKVFRKLQVAAVLAEEVNLPVAAVDLKAHSVVTAEQIVLKSMRIPESPDEFAREPSEIIGRRVSASMVTGDPFVLRDLERLPVVTRGQAVSIESNVGLIRIRATGVAREDGAVGDRIQVLVQSASRIMNAIVVAKGRAEVVP